MATEKHLPTLLQLPATTPNASQGNGHRPGSNNSSSRCLLCVGGVGDTAAVPFDAAGLLLLAATAGADAEVACAAGGAGNASRMSGRIGESRDSNCTALNTVFTCTAMHKL